MKKTRTYKTCRNCKNNANCRTWEDCMGWRYSKPMPSRLAVEELVMAAKIELGSDSPVDGMELAKAVEKVVRQLKGNYR